MPDGLTRRDFVWGVGLLAGSVFGSASLARAGASGITANDERNGHPSMKLGLVTYQMGEHMSLDELIATCEKARFDGVELRSTHKHGVEPSLTSDQRKAVRDRFASSTVKLACLGSACEFDSPDLAALTSQKDAARAFIDLAVDVGAEAVKVRPNNLHEDKGIPVDDTLKQIGRALRDLGGYAGDRSVKLWLEVHGRGTSHVPHCARIMEVCDLPNVGLTWNCNAQDIIDGSLRENYELAKRWIRCLHIHDLYDTSYPYGELLSLLSRDRWYGWANQEMGGSPDPERVLSYYRALFDYMVDEARRHPA